MSINDQINSLENQRDALCNIINEKFGTELPVNSTLLDMHSALSELSINDDSSGGG